MFKKKVFIIAVLGLTTLFCCGYVAWYSYNRGVKIAQAEECSQRVENPTPVTGGLLFVEPCLIIAIPPSLWNLIHGNIAVGGVPKSMTVNPYSFKDVLFGNYTLGPNTNSPCDQSATTTPCATIISSAALK